MNSRTRIAAAMLAVAAVAGTAAGCSSDDDDPGKVRFALDWTPNTNHTGLYVAIDQGYFEDEGIEVEILPYSETSTETIIENGAAEFGISFQSSAVFAAASGSDNTSVMSVLQHNAGGIAVLEERDDITSPKDLDGQTFGNAGDSVAGIKQITDTIVNDGGKGKFEDVTLGHAAYEALYAGKVDFTSGFATWEGIHARLKGTPMKFFFQQDYGLPDTYYVLIQSNSEWIEENPDEAEGFVRALQKGYAYAADNPDEASQILIDMNPGVFEDERLVFESQKELSADYLKDEAGVVGTQTPEKWQTYIDYLVENELLTDGDGEVITEPMKAEDLFTNEFIETE